jgi:hypothetical protein
MELQIEKQKIIDYLLKPTGKADKSKFLNKIGYTTENREQLRFNIMNQFSGYYKKVYRKNKYGTLYIINGKFKAPCKIVDITTIWIKIEEKNYLKLVTLFPNKKSYEI